MINIKNKLFIVLFFLNIIILLSNTNSALSTGFCTPDNCPEGYQQSEAICSNGQCYITCSFFDGCSASYNTIYTDSEYLPNLNILSYSGAYYKEFQIGNFTVNNTNKCYRFRQTTPNNFISSSDIDGYSSTADFDSGIALFWADNGIYDPDRALFLRSIWYDNQKYYTTGANSEYASSNAGGVWVDSCRDAGDNFDEADSFIYSNFLYCAPNQNACNHFNESCDTDCYNEPTELLFALDSDLENSLACNDFSDFADVGWGVGAEIDYVNFNPQTIYMYVDEYNAILNNSYNITCNYWQECNPADPCCDISGHLRANGYVCMTAHNAACDSALTSGCDGHAYEDRCDGTHSYCQDNNFLIDYDGICTGNVCQSQSCSNSVLQPQRTCRADICQNNLPYNCPNNLNCQDAASCKLNPSSAADCRSGYNYSSQYDVCWLNQNLNDEYGIKYDLNGNLLSALQFNYSYDNSNRLINITNSSGSLIARYDYDYQGNRIKKVFYKGNQSTTTYYFDNFVQIINSSGVYNETYYYYYNQLIGKKDLSGKYYFYHADQLGSITLVTNSSGGLVTNLEYDSFGENLTNLSERYGYAGYEYDPESTWLYLTSRYYDPEQGQFLQPDNLIGDIYNPQDINKYAYVRNNPYSYTDPEGEWIHMVIGAAIGAVVGGGYSAISQYSSTGTINWGDVGKSAIAGGVTGGVGAATFGLVGGAIGATTAGGMVLSDIGAGVVSGSAAGVAGQVSYNALSGNNLLEGTSEAMAWGGATGGVLGGVSGGISALRGGNSLGSSSLKGAANPAVRESINKGVIEHNKFTAQARSQGLTANEAVFKGLPEKPLARPDVVDFQKGIITELKPNTPTGRITGEKQLQRYTDLAKKAFPETDWKGRLEFYD